MTVTDPNVASQLADIRGQLDTIEADRIDDPLSSAEDVAAWQGRDAERTARSVALATRAADLRQHGVLVANPHIAGVIRSYEEAVTFPRQNLAYVTRTRSVGQRGISSNDVNGPIYALHQWQRALTTFGRRLPTDSAAQRLLRDEWEKWLTARTALSIALLAAAESIPSPIELPCPEYEAGGLPVDIKFGAYFVDPADSAA